MNEVRFPFAVTFNESEWAMTKAQALKVLEEAAELTEAVKGYEHVRSEEWFDASEMEAKSAMLAMRFSMRMHVIDEAMDVYQALANLIAGEFTDDEIADAYGKCVDRNRERGRL